MTNERVTDGLSREPSDDEAVKAYREAWLGPDDKDTVVTFGAVVGIGRVLLRLRERVAALEAERETDWARVSLHKQLTEVKDQLAAARECLTECEEYFDGRADVDHQGDPMRPVPNKDMNMREAVRAALSATEPLAKAVLPDAPEQPHGGALPES